MHAHVSCVAASMLLCSRVPTRCRGARGEQVLEQMVECGAATDVGHASITPYTVLIRACGKVRDVPSTHARHPTLYSLLYVRVTPALAPATLL